MAEFVLWFCACLPCVFSFLPDVMCCKKLGRCYVLRNTHGPPSVKCMVHHTPLLLPCFYRSAYKKGSHLDNQQKGVLSHTIYVCMFKKMCVTKTVASDMYMQCENKSVSQGKITICKVFTHQFKLCFQSSLRSAKGEKP